MESLDLRIAQLLAENRSLLISKDADAAWWQFAEACILRRRNLNRRLFEAQRRMRAFPRVCGVALLRIALLLLLLAACGAAARWHLRQTGQLEDAINTMSFRLRQVSVALGLHRLRYLQDQVVSEAPCLLPVPLPAWGTAAAAAAPAKLNLTAPSAAAAPETCCICNFEVRQSRLRNVTAAVANYRAVASRPRPKPFVLTNGGATVTYADLRQLYLSHRDEIESTGYSWVSRLPSTPDGDERALFGGLSALFADPSGPPASIPVAWRVMHVEAVRLLRRLVPRPVFVAPEMEIGLIRQLVFLGSGWRAGNEAPLRLPREMQNIHLTLLDGEPVLVTLTPRPGCDCGAGMRAVSLRPGELLFFRASCHRVGIARFGAAVSVGHSVLHIGSQL